MTHNEYFLKSGEEDLALMQEAMKPFMGEHAGELAAAMFKSLINVGAIALTKQKSGDENDLLLAIGNEFKRSLEFFVDSRKKAEEMGFEDE